MQLNLTHGTFLFLITVIISTNLSQNGEVQGASVALEAANAKELAIAGKFRYISIWDLIWIFMFWCLENSFIFR